MRAHAVVVVAPTFDLFAGLAERIERVLVQAFVSKLAEGVPISGGDG
jgi:hypothetical protein